jgi:hypothetical protein
MQQKDPNKIKAFARVAWIHRSNTPRPWTRAGQWQD